MKSMTIFIAVLLMILCSGSRANEAPSEPVETISTTPQVQKPTDEPEVSSTPTSTSTRDTVATPSVTEPESTKTSQPEPIESPATTTPANPAETQEPEPTNPPVTETPEPTTIRSTEPDIGLKWEDYDLAEALNDNKEFLEKYVDTPTNFLISLLGLNGIVNQINSVASENVTLTETCIPLVGEITDINVAVKYHRSFVEINSRMAACNERTLEVRQSRDVGSFESALSDTVDVLQDYQALLESFKDEVGG